MLLKLKFARFAIILVFVLSVFFFYENILYLEKPYPNTTYLFKPNDLFNSIQVPLHGVHIYGDLYLPIYHASEANPYKTAIPWSTSNYLPLASLFLTPFTILDYWSAVRVFQLMIILIILSFIHKMMKVSDFYEHSMNLLVFALILYPAQIVLDRCNLEVIVFLFNWLFVYFYLKEKEKVAAACLALAAGFKVIPAVFGLILIQQRKWKTAFLSFFIFILITGASFFCFKVSAVEIWNGMIKAFQEFTNIHTAANNAFKTNSSLFTLFKGIELLFPGNEFILVLTNFLENEAYYPLASILFVISVFTLMVSPKMKLWESLTIISFLFVLTPKISPDYRHLHFLIPFSLLLKDETENQKWLWTFTALFVLIFLPKGLFHIEGDTSIGAILNPILFLIGLVLINGKYLAKLTSGQNDSDQGKASSPILREPAKLTQKIRNKKKLIA